MGSHQTPSIRLNYNDYYNVGICFINGYIGKKNYNYEEIFKYGIYKCCGIYTGPMKGMHE